MSPNTVVPTANTVYLEGRNAYLSGINRKENPYINTFLQELDYVWTSEDVWNLGWDLEEELYEHTRTARG